MICRDIPTHGWVSGWMGGSVGRWVGLGHITKYQINLDLIEIIQFCLNIYDLLDILDIFFDILLKPPQPRMAVADPGFSRGVPTPKNAFIFEFFAENCMKMKEFGPPGGVRP